MVRTRRKNVIFAFGIASAGIGLLFTARNNLAGRSMPHVLGDHNDPRIKTDRGRPALSHAFIAYAIICILAVIFVIASALATR